MISDNALKKKWIEALRSGKYRQGRGVLKMGERFCCLGVLLDVKGAVWVAPTEEAEVTADRDLETGAMTCLAWETCEALGFSGKNMGLLIRMNDDGKTFAEIADVIERME